MTIKTKFNVGDEVWVMYNNILQSGKIMVIETYSSASTGLPNTIIQYGIFSSTTGLSSSIKFDETKVFKSKAAILKSF